MEKLVWAKLVQLDQFWMQKLDQIKSTKTGTLLISSPKLVLPDQNWSVELFPKGYSSDYKSF